MFGAIDHIFIRGTNNKAVKITDAVDDMVAYTRLTDDIITMIDNLISNDPKVLHAQHLIEELHSRRLWKYLDRTKPNDTRGKLEYDEIDAIEASIFEKAAASQEGKAANLKRTDVVCDLSQFDYGAKDQNPVDRCGINSLRHCYVTEFVCLCCSACLLQALALLCFVERDALLGRDASTCTNALYRFELACVSSMVVHT